MNRITGHCGKSQPTHELCSGLVHYDGELCADLVGRCACWCHRPAV